jgi:hypothetical protein
MGGTLLISSDGSNTATTGGDIAGGPGDYSVTGLGSTVSLSSNLGTGVLLGDVLTLIQASPPVAQFATPSNSGSSTAFGSNSTFVSETTAVGASSNTSRADHTHGGISLITASSSNTLQRGTFNLRPGSNVSFGLTDSDSDGELDTVTINGAAGGGSSPSSATWNVPMLLQSTKASADTPDDDFTGTSLDAKWTATDGTAGTVSLLGGAGSGVYQVGARDGWINFMVGTSAGDSVDLRQDYTLPDGKCIVAYVTFAIDNSAALAGNNEMWVGIGVNDNDSGPYSGAAGQTATIIFDTDANGTWRILGIASTVPNLIGTAPATSIQQALTGVFMRIDRSGLN